VKNRLARLAGTEKGFEALRPHLKGPIALVIAKDDPVSVAKALTTFARTNQALAIKAGFVDGQLLAPDGIRALSELPSKEALRSQLVGAIQGPLAQLVGLLSAPQRELVYVLEQHGKAAAE
jgi:large subunit ribosomal protein L10